MDTSTHKMVVLAGAIAMSLSYIILVACLAYMAITHDGIYATYVDQALIGSGVILAVTLLGAPVVLALLQSLGFRLPLAPLSPTPQDPVSPPPSDSQTGAP